MRRCFALMIGILATMSGVRAQVKPVLTISFDNGFDGIGRDGEVKGTLVDHPVLVPGKFGKALKAGPATGQIDYPTRGVLNPAGGTVEMWVCPVDWAPGDNKFHTFFEAKGQGALYLYEYWTSANLLMLTCDDVNGPYASSQHPTVGWKPGEWHYIAGTWSSRGVMCYVDGKPAGPREVAGNLPKSFGPTFCIGDQPWQFPRTTSSLIDDVRIYDRALTPAHIAAHFTGNYDFTVPLTAQTARLDYSIDPTSGTVTARVDTGGADIEDNRISARVAIVAKGSALPDDATECRFSAGQASLTLPLPGKKPGDYDVVASVLRDGKPDFELRQDLTIPSLEWLGNKIGLDDKVLPPWTPMETTAAGVSCWGRQYEFGKSPLPEQMTSAGASLLAAPVSLHLSRGGQTVRWTTGTRRQTLSAARTRFEATGTMGGTLDGKPVQVNVHTTAEYDGLMLVELSLPSTEKLDLDAASLEIPLRSDHAIYRHRWAASWAGVTGNLPVGKSVVDHDKFIPYYWLGDNDRGLFWFCESDEMWPNGQSDNAIEVVREGDRVVLRLNLLAAKQKLPANWKFVFGLQATPVKPIPRDWRAWRMDPGRNPTVSVVWPKANAKDSFRYFGYPEARDPATFAKVINGMRAQGIAPAPYLCLTFINDAIPEWKYFRKIWEMGPVDHSIPRAGWDHGFAMVSPVGKGYSDFIAWKTHNFLKQYGINGQYHDQTHPYISKNVLAGVGYMRDGVEHDSFPILGFRALYRRIYATLKDLYPHSFSMAHMSGKVTIPILAYEDAYLDGENFRGQVKDDYMDVLSLDTFRAEFMGRQWGIMPFFLPEFRAPYSEQVAPTRGMMGLLMIHDVNVWPIWCNKDVVNKAFAALDEFGCVDADFIPYFDPTPPATTDMKDVYASAYKRKDGRALLVVANLSREDRHGTLHINAARLGLKLNRVISWPDKQSLTVRGNGVTLDVPGLGYRMLVVEAK